MLNEVKHLGLPGTRPEKEILRIAQDDKNGVAPFAITRSTYFYTAPKNQPIMNRPDLHSTTTQEAQGTLSPTTLSTNVKPYVKSAGWSYTGRQTDDGDFGPASAWVNSNGDYGCHCHISNHSIWEHAYSADFHIGRVNPDGHFVSLLLVKTNQVMLRGHHAEGDATAGGSEGALKTNFDSVTHILPIWHENN